MKTLDSIEWQSAPTSEQQVVETLRTAILAGKLPVGEFLSQRKLAALAGSSVISVRGALRQLENEGLVENVPRFGVRIPEDTPATVRDRYLIRNALESAAIEKIHGNIPEDVRKKLLDMASELDHLTREHAEDSCLDFARLHQKFHLLIAETTGSPLLVQMLKRVINPSLMAINAKRSWQIPGEQHANHTLLAEAIVSADSSKAIREMRNHIQTGLESELATL